jgi:hypothetical protein
MPLQIRRGTTADRLAITPLVGEIVYDTTTASVYVGNGTTAGGLPVTNFSVGDARSTTAKLFLGESLSDNSVHSGVTFAYIGDRLQATVQQDLSNYIGLIVADQGFKGNLWSDDSGQIIDSATKTVYGTFVPENDIVASSGGIDLGSSVTPFYNLYVNGQINLGDAIITGTGTAIDLPTGSTIGGQPVGINEGDTYNITISGNVIGVDSTVLVDTTNGTFRGDLLGSVFSDDDSTILVDSRNGVLRGELIGTLTGNVTGNVTGIADTAVVANTVALTPASSSTSIHYINFSLNSSGNEAVRTDTSLQYQPSTNTLGLSILNATTINATTASFSNLTGTSLFTSLIDSADSSAIRVTPAMIFSSDVTFENELFVGGDIFPSTSESYSLGSYTQKFNKLYLTEGNNALWIGNAAISGSGTVINLPAGSTVGGSAITTAAGANATTISVNTSGTSADHFISFFDDQSGDNLIYTNSNFKFNPGTGVFTVGDATIGTVTGNLVGNVTGELFGNSTGYHNGDMKGSVFGFDSSVLVDAVDGVLRGTLIGALTGNVTGNVTGNLTGNVTSTTGTSSFAAISTSNSVTQNTLGLTTISSNSVGATLLNLSQSHASTDARNFAFTRTRGLTTSPSIVFTGDDLADIVFTGYGTSAYVTGAAINVVVVDPAPSNTSLLSKIVFSGNNGNGTSLQDNVIIEGSGQLTVNYGLSTGSLQLIENNISTLNSNDDIVLDPNGTGTVDFVIEETSSVGAPGAASALPVTPSTYFKIKVNGTTYVVPAYAVA